VGGIFHFYLLKDVLHKTYFRYTGAKGLVMVLRGKGTVNEQSASYSGLGSSI